MRIISASRRTDIPAFYTAWLLNRLRTGSVRVPNPFNPRQIATVGLDPRQVASLVLWTKDPRPLLPHLDELEERGYRTLFHVTLTGHPPWLERHVPPGREIAAALQRLAGRVGPARVVWRFDPVMLPPLVPVATTLATFTALAAALQGSVGRVVISFARPYAQVRSRMRRQGLLLPDIGNLPAAEQVAFLAPLATGLAAAASRFDLPVFACGEKTDLADCGIGRARCIDPGQLQEAFGLQLPDRKHTGQRPECGCLPSIDIGIYGTCRHACQYCYAAADRALRHGARHDPDSPFLVQSEKIAAGSEEC